jgi:polysaccharide biosynthesis protein PslH
MKRNQIIIAFDTYYAANATVVYSATRQLIKQFGPEFEYSLFCQGGYFGPSFDGPESVRVLRVPRILSRRSARRQSWLRRLIEIAHVTEAENRWTSNLRPGEDKLARLLFRAERFHAMVMFAGDPGSALRLSRVAHIYSDATIPHLILVTPDRRIDQGIFADLEWLGVRILRDDDQMIDRPPSVVSLNRIPKPGASPERTAFSFLEWEDYPRQFRGSSNPIDWPVWIGAEQPYSRRVRDVVLFIRPDWMNCGSGTTFESLARWFRGRDALLIDVGVWPYGRPFTAKSRLAQVGAEQQHIGAALYFSARMTSSLARVIHQLPNIGRWYPRTWTRQKLLQNTLAAKPRFMRLAIQRAKISQIYVNHYFTYGYAADFIGNQPFFLDTHDIQAVNFIHDDQRNVLTRRVDRFATSLKDEMEIAGRAARLCFVAPEELELAARFISEDRLDYILPLPNIVPCQPRLPHNPARLLMVASDNPPNIRGMKWFLSNVWPTVLQMTTRPPNLLVCGSIGETAGREKVPGVQFVGVVDDLRPYYDGCDIVLLPVINGAGVAIKTLEAVLYERAVLATRPALRGLPDKVVEAIGFEDDPIEYAKLMLAIVRDPKRHRLQLERSRRAAELLRQYPFYEILGKAMDSVRLSAALSGSA